MTKRLTKEERLLHKRAILIANVIGCNVCATNADSLGEKVYWRLTRDMLLAKAKEMGAREEFGSAPGDASILHLPGGPPHIIFQERDIELMRKCVADWDEGKRDE